MIFLPASPLRVALAALLASAPILRAADAVPALTPDEKAGILAILQSVSRHQVKPLSDGDYTRVATAEALKAAKAPEGIQWSYPWGVTLYGTLRSTDFTHDASVETFVLEHNKTAARYYTFLAGEREVVGAAGIAAAKPKIGGLMRLGNLDSCGAMGVEMLEGILRHRDQETPDEKAVVGRIAEWITTKQERLPDGTFWRPNNDGGIKTMKPGTIWMDDLYMGCPFLVRWSAYTGDPKYLDDAANQVIHMAALLQDTDGVWFHAYFVNNHQHSPFKWGRANGWGVVATAEILSALPDSDPLKPKLLEIFRTQVAGVIKLQAKDGLWHQVLDHPEIWEETSASAMFCYGIARGVNRGWLPAEDMLVARRAFEGLKTKVTADGAVNGTCEGTNIGMDLSFYANRHQPDDDLHGRGVVQLAGAELLASGQN